MNPLLTQRIQAIDIFRGLTMFLMLFVNSFWSLSEVPHWLRHAAPEEDMLGLADLVFPAFLFIVGTSVPFAIRNRIRKGDSLAKLIGHVAIRSVALIIIGIYTSNLGRPFDAATTGISRSHFALLMVLGIFLIWNDYPKSQDWKKYLFLSLKVLGVALMVWLALIFRSEGEGVFAIRWGGWRILGQIGWTYLFCSVIYLIFRDRLWWHVGVWGVVIFCSCLQSVHILPKGVFPVSLTVFAFGVTGQILSLLLSRYADSKSPNGFYKLMALIGIGMFAAGIIAHQSWIISKISATPTWYFYSCALFFPIFGLLYFLSDVKNKGAWFDWVKPAGIAALSCFVLEYAWNPVKTMIFNTPVLRPEFSIGVPGLFNSVAYALLFILIVWLLLKIHIKLKL